MDINEFKDLAGEIDEPVSKPEEEVAEETPTETATQDTTEEALPEVGATEEVAAPEEERVIDEDSFVQNLDKVDETKPAEKVEQPASGDKALIEQLQRDLAEHRAIIEELSTRLGKPTEVKPTEATEGDKPAETAKEKPKPAVPAEFKPGVFVESDEDIDKALGDTASLNALLQKVAAYAIENVLSAVPKLVVTLSDQQIVFRQAAKEFWDNNKDLLDKRSFVSFVTNELASKHPEWSLEELFLETEKEVRKKLNIPKQGDVASSPASRRKVEDNAPAFLDTRGARPGRERRPVNTVTQEIEDLISEL